MTSGICTLSNFEQVGELQDKLDEMRSLVGQGDLERRSAQLRFEAVNGKIASFNDDLSHVKDQMRRQIEDSHIALKKQFATFTAQIDTFQQAVDLEKAQTAAYCQEAKRFLALVDHTQHQYEKSMEKFQEIDAVLEEQAKVKERIETQSRQMEMAWENMTRIERSARDMELYLDRYLPLQVQNQVDEALYGTVSRKADLLKQMTDHQRLKYKLLEEKIKAGPKTAEERRVYTMPNFTVRDLEIQRLKNNKSKRSDKNDMTSVKSKGSRFTHMKTLGSGLKQASVSESSQGGRQSSQRQSIQAKKVGTTSKLQAIDRTPTLTPARQTPSVAQAPAQIVENTSDRIDSRLHLALNQTIGAIGAGSALSHEAPIQQERPTSVVITVTQEEGVHQQQLTASIRSAVSHRSSQRPASYAKLPPDTPLRKMPSLQRTESKAASLAPSQRIPRAPTPPEVAAAQEISHEVSLPRTSTMQLNNNSELAIIPGFASQLQEPVADQVPVLAAEEIEPIQEPLVEGPAQQDTPIDDLGENEQADIEVSKRTQSVHKSQAMLLATEEEAERENLAIPEYGGEDIDEAENEYGSSDEEEEEDPRYKEAIEELQAATRNIREDQLDEELRAKLTHFAAEINEIKSRFPESCNYGQVQALLGAAEKAAGAEQLRFARQFAEVQEQLDKLRRQDQENREQLQTELLLMDRRLKKEDSDLGNRIDEFNAFVQELDARISRVTSKDSVVEGLCATLAELALIDVTLMAADEQDKHSISLLGVREDGGSPTRASGQVVTIDRSCLSCSSQSYKILSAFKLACLSYFPAPVGYQNQTLTRLDLIHVKKRLIETQIEKLMHQQNFSQLLVSQKRQASLMAAHISGGKLKPQEDRTTGFRDISRVTTPQIDSPVQIKVEFGSSQVDAVNRKEVIMKNMRKKTEMLLSTNPSLVSPAFRDSTGFTATRLSSAHVGDRENFHSVYSRTRTVTHAVRTPAAQTQEAFEPARASFNPPRQSVPKIQIPTTYV